MSSKLKWTCPVCWVNVTVPADFKRISCRCNSIINRDGTIAVRGTPPDSLPIELLESRQSVCAACTHAGNVRCDLIDAGCRRTYQSRLYSAEGKCPIGLWTD